MIPEVGSRYSGTSGDWLELCIEKAYKDWKERLHEHRLLLPELSPALALRWHLEHCYEVILISDPSGLRMLKSSRQYVHNLHA